MKPAVASKITSREPAAELTEPRATAPTAPAAPIAKESTKEVPTEDSPSEDSPAAALCGHRSLNSRSCRRPAGHAEKSHRYS